MSSPKAVSGASAGKVSLKGSDKVSANAVMTWVKENPGKAVGVLVVVVLAVGALTWVYQHWGIIQGLGVAAALALAFPFLVPILAGIIGITATALLTSAKALRTELSEINDSDKDDKTKADETKKAQENARQVRDSVNRATEVNPGGGAKNPAQISMNTDGEKVDADTGDANQRSSLEDSVKGATNISDVTVTPVEGGA